MAAKWLKWSMCAGMRYGLTGAIGVAGVTTLGCENTQKPVVTDETAQVVIDGHTFTLELALTQEQRFHGLSDREHIEPNGGMLFVFKRPARQNFVMRDCPIPIDIIYLDASGRITASHQMQVEEPRREGESDYEYDARLKKYSSRYDAQFVIELAGGTLDELSVKDGDLVALDTERLKSMAR